MNTRTEGAFKVNAIVLSAVTEILGRAILAQREVAHDQTDLQQKRDGAYSLYVQAGIKAARPEYLVHASDSLFTEIRKTGTVNGKSLHCKKGKEGGFVIPSAISAAKSVMVSALNNGISLKDEKGKARSFSSIRKDVFAISQKAEALKEQATEKARIEALTGADKLRETEGKRILSELASIVAKEAKEADLQDLLNRVNSAMRDYGLESEEMSEQGDDVTALVKEAAPKAAKPARRVHSKKRQQEQAAA